MTELQGRRLDTIGELYSDESRPGDYVVITKEDGEPTVYIRDPNGTIGRCGDHKVEVHEDGTVTVDPSILDTSPGGWHGYLQRGIWRSV